MAHVTAAISLLLQLLELVVEMCMRWVQGQWQVVAAGAAPLAGAVWLQRQAQPPAGTPAG
jgi:hypothetical protein